MFEPDIERLVELSAASAPFAEVEAQEMMPAGRFDMAVGGKSWVDAPRICRRAA